MADQTGSPSSPLSFLIAGSSGFLGTLLTEHLRSRGHEVTRLVRREGASDGATWDPYAGDLDAELVERADVVVNLAGSPTAGNPHSKKWARELRESRVTTTRVLADAIAASQRKPAFLAGNGISFYGDHGDRELPETADSRGEALLTQVARDWQAATGSAAKAGARVAVLRTSPVLDKASPPLKQLALLFKTGLAGPLGPGDQYFPTISARDWVGAVAHTATSDVEGPVNLCVPRVPTNQEFTDALARAVGRPAKLRVPSVALKVGAGRLAPELLGSVRGVPKALLDDGYAFADPDITAVIASGLAQRR